MEDIAAIEDYNRAGDRYRGRLGAVHWPDVALDEANLESLAEGLLDSRLEFSRFAFGDEFDADACREQLEEAWRTDEIRARFAPEGVYSRVAFSIRLTVSDPDEPEADPLATETLYVEAELCLSFSEIRHTRPFIDFMGGKVRRISDGASTRLEPFACELSPEEAVTWGLNGCGDN